MEDSKLALFMLLGKTAENTITEIPTLAPSQPLLISASYDLATLMPQEVKESFMAAEAYKLFFVFEQYLRAIVSEILTGSNPSNWWDEMPNDVQEEVAKLEETEEIKSWMALGSRDRFSLMTYPQLVRVIEHCWKPHFEEIIRDKGLIHEARLIAHLRNRICHMSPISSEEMERIRQTIRDWFRMVAP